MVGPPRQIVLIRHAEKPAARADGVNVKGAASDRCLTPRGWQRAGALPTLLGDPREPLTRPDRLYSPEYENDDRTINHRTYETILPLADRLGLEIVSPHKEGHEAKLARHMLASDGGTSLVCWEHTLLVAIASEIPLTAGSARVPEAWPDDRFDLVWLFDLTAGEARYTFSQLPQLLLAGDGAV
jgi:hypothetical protein